MIVVAIHSYFSSFQQKILPRVRRGTSLDNKHEKKAMNSLPFFFLIARTVAVPLHSKTTLDFFFPRLLSPSLDQT